jgi:hypothetical protein
VTPEGPGPPRAVESRSAPPMPDLDPPPSLVAPARAAWRPVLELVYEQAWGLCVGYLALGLVAEVLRRLGVPGAATVQEFLDGLPYFALRVSGLLELYLRASAVGQLSPFWNRVLLSSITVGAILVQATLLGALLAVGWKLARPRRRDGR